MDALLQIPDEGKILITGASGNVGGAVAKHLIGCGRPVVLAGTRPEALRAAFGDQIECVRFDFTDPTTFSGALAGVDRVFIMRPPHLGKPADLKPFIDALQSHRASATASGVPSTGGIRLVCFLSLIGIEHNPMPPHYRIEKFIEQAGLPFCHIRPSFFMQNLSGIHAFEIRHFNRIVVPVGKALTSFIDADDIGELTARILCEPDRHRNRAYSITGPEAIDYFSVARILSEELGRPILYANPGAGAARRYWTDIRGLEQGYATVMGLLYMMTRLGTARQVTVTFAELLGRNPRTFREFVRANKGAWE